MERYSGRATIRSSPGAGTEVELVLPIKTAIQVTITARTDEISAWMNHGGHGGAGGNSGFTARGPRTPIANISATLMPIVGNTALAIHWLRRNRMGSPGDPVPTISGCLR